VAEVAVEEGEEVVAVEGANTADPVVVEEEVVVDADKDPRGVHYYLLHDISPSRTSEPLRHTFQVFYVYVL